MAFTEDLAAFYTLKSAGGLADPATHASTTKPVFFDQGYLEQFEVAGTNPVARARASDFAVGDIGTSIVIGGVTYAIRGREPIDDGAEVLLQLEAP
jgi:hypothetical protein